jgi:hypothetical protein
MQPQRHENHLSVVKVRCIKHFTVSRSAYLLVQANFLFFAARLNGVTWTKYGNIAARSSFPLVTLQWCCAPVLAVLWYHSANYLSDKQEAWAAMIQITKSL